MRRYGGDKVYIKDEDFQCHLDNNMAMTIFMPEMKNGLSHIKTKQLNTCKRNRKPVRDDEPGFTIHQK